MFELAGRELGAGQKTCPICGPGRCGGKASWVFELAVFHGWHEQPDLRRVRQHDETERTEQLREDPVAVRTLRRLVHAEARRPRRRPEDRPGLAVLQGHAAGGVGRLGAHASPPQPDDVVAQPAHAPARKTVRRGARRRDLAAPEGGRAHRDSRRARGRLARRPQRVERLMGGALMRQIRAPKVLAGLRRRQRHRQGHEDGLAGDPDAALPVPRLHEHHGPDRQTAQARGRPGAAETAPTAQPGQGRRHDARLARGLQPVGTGMGRVPRREERIRGRQPQRRPPAPRPGAAHDPQADLGARHGHVHRPATGMRRAGTAHEQPLRVMEPAASRHAPRAQRPAPHPRDQGHLLVVLHAHRTPGGRGMARPPRHHRRSN